MKNALFFASLLLASSAQAQVSGDVIRIGMLTDLAGPYADIDGMGGLEAVRMAIADQGGIIDGKAVEFVFADHQNKANVAANKARDMFDQMGVDVLIGGPHSASSLAMAKVAAERHKLFIAVGAGSAQLTNEACTPYTIHYAYDAAALARSAASAIVRQGAKTWYFLTNDQPYAVTLERDAGEALKASGGVVVGALRHTAAMSDPNELVQQALASKAQMVALAASEGDAIAMVKAASGRGVRVAGLLMFINDIHVLGLQASAGTWLVDGWYWDMNAETRAWSKRFFGKMKRAPSMQQAADYSAVSNYLKAVKKLGSDDPDKVMAELKASRINDMFAKNGEIRPDGRMVHDLYLMEVKKPSESRYPWDYYKIVQTIPGSQAFAGKEESRCALWK